MGSRPWLLSPPFSSLCPKPGDAGMATPTSVRAFVNVVSLMKPPPPLASPAPLL